MNYDLRVPCERGKTLLVKQQTMVIIQLPGAVNVSLGFSKYKTQLLCFVWCGHMLITKLSIPVVS